MRYLILFFIIFSVSVMGETAQDVYNKALQLEEIKGDFSQAKRLYQTVMGTYVQDQEYVARSIYKIAFISEIYGENTIAENYYKLIVSKYKNYPGLKILASKGLYRIKKSKDLCSKPENIKKEDKKAENKTEKKETPVKKVEKDPFSNNKYRTGKIEPIHIIDLNSSKTIEFDGVKGLGLSDPSIIDIKPTTSKLEITGKKVGKVEIMIKGKDGKEHIIHIAVIDKSNLDVKDNYIVKGYGKKIYIENISKIAMDNDNIDIKAKDGVIDIKGKKEGDIKITVERKDGSKVNFSLKVYKSYDKTEEFSLKLLETKEIKFKNISTTSLTNQGIVDIKTDENGVKITATQPGETIIILYGSDGAKLKCKVVVKK